eukprot:TRINITY_DN50336_c0_g1_i1.p1 TRINITY_DN50336_c0_g1~~TRINITY_DN50336_c0_g1_i1.p1  ORF type:complete len:939 (-),score=205.44 TRINITY_DN50336_c0_g1_i1:140-2860(-)
MAASSSSAAPPVIAGGTVSAVAGLGRRRLPSCETESFYSLCTYLESLHLKKKEDKLNALEKYLKRFDLCCDLYPLLRLLLPSTDPDRGAFGLKESQLAKIYGELLGLPEGQRQRLLHWKDPALQEGYKCAAGDFASVLYSVVESRATVKPGEAKLTIADVNAGLDGIAHAADNKDKRQKLLDLARRATATEQKWLAKMIVKDLKIGFSHESVLKRFHPDAMELYNRSSNLKTVLDEIRSQLSRAQAGGASALKMEAPGGTSASAALPGGQHAPVAASDSILFSKFKPMLSQRLSIDQVAGVLADSSKNFVMEAKYDGERILAHIDRDSRRVELYTRNAMDYTGIYAPTMKNVLLSGVNGRRVVLDGEMLAWDENEQSFIAFGSNRTVAMGNDATKHLCYVVFDILYYMDAEGQVFDLRRTRLARRRELCERVVEVRERWLEVAPSVPAGSAADVLNRLEGAMDFRQEGVILKDADAPYFFNARKRGWYKIKPEYDGLSDTLDLLVIGAYFADSLKRRAGQGQSTDLVDNVSQFLLAALRGDGKDGELIVTVGRVGTGFSMKQLGEMRDRLRPHLRRYDPHRAPSWLGGWRGAGKAKPDVILDSPRHAFVMEIRAAEIVPTDEYEFGYTLRFPRAVQPIRADKDWNDANTEVDLKEYVRGGRNQLTSARVKPKVEVRSEGEETDEEAATGSAKRRKKDGDKAIRASFRRARSYGVLEGFREADTRNVPVATTVLKGAEVFVISGDAQYCKADLEAYVVRHGGRNVQNYIKGRTSLVVAASMADLRAQNLAKTAQVDIVKYQYLFQCVDAGRMLPQQPRHMLSSGPELQKRFSQAFDKWGDAFYEAATIEGLKEALEDIAERESTGISQDLVDALRRHPRFRPPPGSDGLPLPWLSSDDLYSDHAAVA